MGRLERHLDQEAVARVLNKTPRQKPTVTRRRKPRKAGDYRAARRNDAKGTVWQGAPLTRPFSGIVPLNRSRHHPFATQYVQARAMAIHRSAEVQHETVR